MPACPLGGCICAWGWVPNGCGEPNMYHQPFKCNVTGATSTTPLATPRPPVWCEDDQSKCVKGAKQMIYWHQQDGNNIAVDGYDLSGSPKSPAYNAKCGFPDGAQDDIFSGSSNALASPPNSVASSNSSVASSTFVAPPNSSPTAENSTTGYHNPPGFPSLTTSSTQVATVSATTSPSPQTCKRRQKRRSAPDSPSPKKRSFLHHHREYHRGHHSWWLIRFTYPLASQRFSFLVFILRSSVLVTSYLLRPELRFSWSVDAWCQSRALLFASSCSHLISYPSQLLSFASWLCHALTLHPVFFHTCFCISDWAGGDLF